MARKNNNPSKMNMGNPRKPKNTKATFSRLLGYLGRSKVMLLFVFIFEFI